MLAITSHLPHLIAYTIVGTADELAQVTESEVNDTTQKRVLMPSRSISMTSCSPSPAICRI